MILCRDFLAFGGLLSLIEVALSNSVWTLGEKNLPADAYFLRSFHGKVDGGSYSAYQLMTSGNLELVLTTDVGDADIFVSSRTKNPSADDYEYSSFTCGVDSINVDETQPRPVHIGIFGNPHHSESSFTLEAFKIPAKNTYEHIIQQIQEVSYDELVNEHVLIHESSRFEEANFAYRASTQGGQRQDGKLKKGAGAEDGGWASWALGEEEGWVAVVTVVMGVLKLILQILG